MKKEFIEQVTQHEAIIFKVCQVYCHAKEDRQDLFQDIVLQLWRAFPKFKKEAKVSTWIYRIALNTAITRLRKETKKPQRQGIDQDILDLPSPEASQHEERFQTLMHIIGTLSSVEKAIIMLYLDDQSYKEIARIVGLSESNVGYKINQIKGKLKKMINKTHHGT